MCFHAFFINVLSNFWNLSKLLRFLGTFQLKTSNMGNLLGKLNYVWILHTTDSTFRSASSNISFFF